MHKVISLAKKAMGIHPQQGVKPLSSLVHIGSFHHGYHLPNNFLTADSICYCIGAGDDISFDTELKVMYDANVYIFDPTPVGIDHFQQLKTCIHNNTLLTLDDVQKPFTYRITREQLDALTFVEIGVWDEQKKIRFYSPQRENYPSHSVYLFKESNEYIEAPVDRLSNLMRTLGHTTLDVVKLEIEGAEYTVIDTIIDDKLDVKSILVEFDEVHNANDKAFHFRIKKTCDKLKKAGYVLVHSTENLKRTFIREDVYTELKARENEEVSQTEQNSATTHVN